MRARFGLIRLYGSLAIRQRMRFKSPKRLPQGQISGATQEISYQRIRRNQHMKGEGRKKAKDTFFLYTAAERRPPAFRLRLGFRRTRVSHTETKFRAVRVAKCWTELVKCEEGSTCTITTPSKTFQRSQLKSHKTSKCAVRHCKGGNNLPAFLLLAHPLLFNWVQRV